VVWTDGEWEHPSSVWKSTGFLSWLYNESPVKETVVVNDRWGKETRSKHGGYYTTEYDLIGDVNSKEIKISHPWEECRGIGGSFGYNRAESLREYETSASLVHLLIERVAKGGNLLLDIGPAADGTIPVIMQQRLLDMGRWLRSNGEAIYGTTEWRKAPQAKKGTTQYYTQKGKDLYVLCTTYPAAPVVVENIGTPKSVSLLGSQAAIKSSLANGRLTFVPPVLTPGAAGEYAWVFKLEGVL
jgi:alpha-L-fucosidase